MGVVVVVGLVGREGIGKVVSIAVGVGVVGVGLVGTRDMAGVVGMVAVGNSVVAAGRSSSSLAWRMSVGGIGEVVGRLGEVVGRLGAVVERLGAVVDTLVEGMSAERTVEENTCLSVVADRSAAWRRVVELRVTLEVRRSCIAVADPGMLLVRPRSVSENHFLVQSVPYLYLHVQIDLLFRDPLSLDRDRFRLCCRANLDLPPPGRYDLLSESLPDPSFHADLAV